MEALFQRDAESENNRRLSWRGFAVGQNFSNDRRKIINAGARHDDAVPAPMSFLSDTQEFAAVVLPELDIEMLALNLQFFRLDDVVHFALRPPSLGSRNREMEEKFSGFLQLRCRGQNPSVAQTCSSELYGR